MAQLAILGHATRGKEVIEILEMLGGINTYQYYGADDESVYYIKGYDIVRNELEDIKNDDFIVFTLEDFLKKFPYKDGDKVYNIVHNENQTITDLVWDFQENEVGYQTNNNEYVYVNYLQPYKEETMEEKRTLVQIDLTSELCIANEVEVILGDYEFVLKDGKTYFVKKKPKYPKTYEECCKMLGYSGNYNMILTTDVDNKLFNALYRLKVCRDAYWKIAGDWKPNWEDETDIYYTISYDGVNIKCYNNTDVYSKLAFQTEEMRDAFKENFYGDIDTCKELL